MTDAQILLRFYRLFWARRGLNLIDRDPQGAKLAFLAGSVARELEIA